MVLLIEYSGNSKQTLYQNLSSDTTYNTNFIDSSESYVYPQAYCQCDFLQ